MKLINNLILSWKKTRREIKEKFICIIMIVVGTIVGILTWKSVNYASSIFSMLATLLGIDVFADKVFGKKIKSKSIRKTLLVSLLILLVNSTFAHAELRDKKERQNSRQEDLEVLDDDNITAEPAEVIFELFVWEDDIYIMDVSKYVKVSGDTTKCTQKLIKTYTRQYVTEQSVWITKTDEELNGGDYGHHTCNANNYATDYSNVIMDKVKNFALGEEIKEREEAKAICEKFDNLKLLGDAYVKVAENSDLSNAIRIQHLEEAVKNYVRALALAYYDECATNKYISGIWEALSIAYKRISCLETTDAIHAERSKMLGNICELGMTFVGEKS